MLWHFLSKTSLIITLCCLVLGSWLWLFFIRAAWHETKVVFLSVGEGDAILITEGTYQILIDSGREGKRTLSHLGKYIPFYDHTLEVVVSTHPDADHIGGFPDILDHYSVETFFSTGAESDTETETLLEREIERRSAGEARRAIVGTKGEFPNGGTWHILFPFAPLPKEVTNTNATSVVSRFEFGSTSFLFTGDLPDEEAYLPNIMPATVLKVAHHGSRYSTSERWLEMVRPKTAILSVGENRYGHPAPEVLERLAERGIESVRTDTDGDIVYRCRQEWHECRRDIDE